jgi:fumarylacetoacetase
MSGPAKKKQKTQAAASWVAYGAESDFPIQNLPYGSFTEEKGEPRVGVAIGDQVLDLRALAEAGLLTGPALGKGECFVTDGQCNTFMDLGKQAWAECRAALTDLLSATGSGKLSGNASLREKALIPQSKVTMNLPARIGDYTDFYASIQHATNVGTMFRGKDNALQPNWKHLPVGYHGRASSVVVSGTPIRRPWGQVVKRELRTTGPSTFEKCKRMDFELEMGCFVGKGNALGDPLTMAQAEDNIFGLVVMNDWSARDIQAWEYVPLGPFGGKNLGTTISPWIVTTAALAPHGVAHMVQDPQPLPYLREPGLKATDPLPVFDIQLQVQIQPEGAKQGSVVSNSNAKYLYWNFKQQLVHHTVTGCNMQPGDLLGSGTISGPGDESMGSMLELSWNGSREIKLAEGTRKFLEDGDTVSMSGFAQGDGYRIGFGPCVGALLPAHER